MKRRSFLGSIAAGLGALVVPKPKDMDRYYKIETINRDDAVDEMATIGGSGIIQPMGAVAGSGVIPHWNITCSG